MLALAMPDPSSSLSPYPWADVLIILALVCINAVFAMSELALVSARSARLKAMAGAGKKGARHALKLAEQPGRFLSTVQIGITLVGVVAGAYSGVSRPRSGCCCSVFRRNGRPRPALRW